MAAKIQTLSGGINPNSEDFRTAGKNTKGNDLDADVDFDDNLENTQHAGAGTTKGKAKSGLNKFISCIAKIKKFIVWLFLNVIIKKLYRSKFIMSGLLLNTVPFVLIPIICDNKAISFSIMYVYGYGFKPCLIDHKHTLCPIDTLNHTLYFDFNQVYINPYPRIIVSNQWGRLFRYKSDYQAYLDVEHQSVDLFYGENAEELNPELQRLYRLHSSKTIKTATMPLYPMVSYDYNFCTEIPVPKFPANYKRHCNLMAAGTGTEVALWAGYILTVLPWVHAIILANGCAVWNMVHKLSWIFSLNASLCYLFSYLIWLILGHIDIVAQSEMHSESFAGMRVVIYQGPAMYLILLCCLTMFGSAVLYRIHVWRMKTINLKYLYEDSQSSSEILKSAQIDFLLNPTESD